jgi:fumarate reductase flavoprotein subunit
MKIIYTDVLVIGGGLAGLRIAVGAKRRGHDAIILSLVPPKRSHSAAAQGGMQAIRMKLSIDNHRQRS